MELVTGKKPQDRTFGESKDIVEWVREKVREGKVLEDSLDKTISGECKYVQEEMILVLKIALLCTAKLPKDRPAIRDVIGMLTEAKPRRKSVSQCVEENVSKIDKPIFSASPELGFL